MLVGRVTDYAIDTQTLDVLAIEMIPGYGPHEINSRIWVYGYSASERSDEIVIPDILPGKPSFSREGDGVCVYRR